ncbi:hypothetical protein, partial [Pseudomonas sp. Marseille-Q1929]|uniref:hypothetical protein n=1 Tax=Pseudomonas sp. Marseille-Q1929 TaxID=2730402 RepID=UPI001A8E0FAF
MLHHTKNAETLCIDFPNGRLKEHVDPWQTFFAPKTKPHLLSQMGFRNLILTMTYSHMGKPHTTIGDASFH